MQTIGTLTVMLAIVLAFVAGAVDAPAGPQYDWVNPTLAGFAFTLALVGLVTSIVGRVRNKGHV